LSDPQALHLLGIVEKQQGHLEKAANLFARAAEALPNDADLANNRANLFRQLGDDDAAEASYQRALKLRPDFVTAATALGRLHIDHERFADAEAVYQRLPSEQQSTATVAYGMATAALGLGLAERAESLLNAAIRQYGDVPEMLFMRGRARAELGNPEALDDYRRSYTAKPTGYALKALASLLYMNGEEAEFRSLLQQEVASHPALAGLAASLLKDAGDPAAAVEMLAGRDDTEELLASRAAAHLELGEAGEAETLSRQALQRAPAHRVSSGNLVSALLMQGRYDDALPLIRELRAAEPDRQHWIAYEATALRHTDPDAYRALVRVDEHVQPYRLPTPKGYDSLEAFNDAFMDVLNELHLYRQRPLDQSLRGGTQTARDLMGVDHPVVDAFRDALDEPIRAYLESIGTAEDHPLTARNRGTYKFQGCWSVRLVGQGFHVNHVHPEGWISSAYYVSVPPLEDDGRHAGWIKFGEPPFATTPASPPERWVRPESGMLVLFPSFLWHGTGPIDDDAVRVTAPFDAVPG